MVMLRPNAVWSACGSGTRSTSGLFRFAPQGVSLRRCGGGRAALVAPSQYGNTEIISGAERSPSEAMFFLFASGAG
jgi:hypothetical protein